MSVNSTDPQTLFGGTWERIAQGRTIVGEGVVQANSDNWCGTTNTGDWTAYAGFTGGEVFHTLTVSEMPKHHHDVYIKANQVAALGDVVWVEQYDANNTTVRCTETGGNQPHNNMPPYLVVYMWKRTA